LLANARFAGERSANPDIKHNSYQWDVVYNNNDIFKGGWAGQGLLINRERDLVAVYLGYIKEDGSELAVLPRLRELLKTIYPK
jgi:hypothetical protein